MSTEIPLAGGDVSEGVVRVEDTVRRPRGPWSDSVAAYLRHLEQVGFQGAPRWLGVDERGRDVLDFVPGDVPGEPVVEEWAITLPALTAVARLLRRLHDASATFVPPPDACWFGEDIRVDLPAELVAEPRPELVSHFDVTPQNVVFRDGVPVALIDFDLTRPGTRVRDVANAAMYWVPLVDPGDRDPAFASCDVVDRLAAFVDAYGLSAEARQVFCDDAIAAASRSWHRMRANAEQRGGGWARMWSEGVGDRILRRRAWLVEHRPALKRALRSAG